VKAEDSFRFTVSQLDAPDVTVTSAPRPENRLETAIREFMRRIRVERKPNTISWDELREAGRQYGVPIDPRDIYEPEDHIDRRGRELPSQLLGLNR